MTAVQEKRELSNEFQNDGFSIGAGNSMTFHMGSGTDDDDNRYLNLDGGISFGIEVIPTVACSITKINGKTLKVAMSIGTGGYRPQHGRFTNITIQAGSTTDVEVGGKS